MRITRKFLEARVETVNQLLGYDREPAYATEGAFTLSGAYGGYAVHRYSGPHGGVSQLTSGHIPARECELFLSGMISALRIAEVEK